MGFYDVVKHNSGSGSGGGTVSSEMPEMKISASVISVPSISLPAQQLGAPTTPEISVTVHT